MLVRILPYSATVLLGLLLSIPSAVKASPTNQLSPEEDRLLKAGVKLREAGDEHHAVVELQKAYDIGHSPRAAGQLGLSEWALGRWVEAEAHVTEALKATDDPFLKDKKRRQILERALNTIQPHLGTIEITGEPVGAEVIVAGKIVGKFPLPVPVRSCIGTVDVEVSAEGFETEKRAIALASNQYQRVLIRLKRPAPVVATVTNTSAPPSPSSSVTINVLPSATQNPTTHAETQAPAKAIPISEHSEVVPTWRAVAKWSAFGGSVGLLGIGIVSNVLYSKRTSDFTEYCDKVGNEISAKPGSGYDNPRCSSLYNKYNDLEKAGIVGYVGAGVLATTWLVLWMTEPSSPTSKTVAWACAPEILATGVSCAFQF